jgi:hypothetical protein
MMVETESGAPAPVAGEGRIVREGKVASETGASPTGGWCNAMFCTGRDQLFWAGGSSPPMIAVLLNLRAGPVASREWGDPRRPDPYLAGLGGRLEKRTQKRSGGPQPSDWPPSVAQPVRLALGAWKTHLFSRLVSIAVEEPLLRCVRACIRSDKGLRYSKPEQKLIDFRKAKAAIPTASRDTITNAAS